LCVVELLSHLLVHSIGDYNSKQPDYTRPSC
jgi:hypothetical protein